MRLLANELEPGAWNKTSVVCKVLLLLRNESLMEAVKHCCAQSGEKVDYSNAAAWMRDVPGRMSEHKIDVLMRYLGLGDTKLDPSQLHRWFVPRKDDGFSHSLLLTFIQQFAGELQQHVLLRDPMQTILGLALKAGPVSLVFLPRKGGHPGDLLDWQQQLPASCLTLPDDQGVQSKAFGERLRSRDLIAPQCVWTPLTHADTQAWESLNDELQRKGLTPRDVSDLVEVAQSLRRLGESTQELKERVDRLLSDLRT